MASAFQERPGVRERVTAAKARGTGVVLSGGGGMGKSQLAASYAHQACRDGADLVVWVAAAEIASVIIAYAEAAERVGVAPEKGSGDPYVDAKAFIGWLTGTGRTWLVVLDDLTDPAAMGLWWPTSDTGTGRVLGTTRRRGAAVSGVGRVSVDVDTYLPGESCDYLNERLTGHGRSGLLDRRIDNLTAELGHLPLALSHAAAYMIDQDVSCAEYETRFAVERGRLDELMPRTADTDNYGRAVATTWSLSIVAANAADPVGLAVPAVRLASMLDPAGHPKALWDSEAVRNYLTANRVIPEAREPQPSEVELITQAGTSADEPVTGRQALAAMGTLDRFSLITNARDDSPDSQGDAPNRISGRAIRMHGLTQRAVIETLDQDALADAVWAAADALLSIWPTMDVHADAEVSAALRSNTDMVARRPSSNTLWQPGAHRLLYRAGESWDGAGLFDSAITYWTALLHDAERLLDVEHPDTLTARDHLATAYQRAGRSIDAIELLEQLVADSRRLLGPKHPNTLTARTDLATSYRLAGRTKEAIALLEQVVADRELLLGPGHLDTLTARTDLATAYQRAGRTTDAIKLLEPVLADLERLGTEHPANMAAQDELADSYFAAGRTNESIVIQERVVAYAERVMGAEHLSTLNARGNLARSYRSAGRNTEAIELKEQVATGIERVVGAEHPDALTARANLASSYYSAGRITEAIALQERVAADSKRLLGAEHPFTLAARGDLASSYSSAGRHTEAIALLEQLVADSRRLLGAEHPRTLAARINLASSYWADGRTSEAIGLLEHMVADTTRLLGPEHPRTLAARANLANSYYSAGRITEAINVMERVVEDTKRLLGPEHPDTLLTQGNLANSYSSAGRTTEAISLQEQVAADSERLLGIEHPQTLKTLSNLASHYRSVGRTTEAIGLLERVAVERERLLGPENSDTLTGWANLFGTYWAAGRTTDAIGLLRRVAADSERLLGADHPETKDRQEALQEWTTR